MNWITILWAMMASAALTLGLISLVIWVKQRTQIATLAFFGVAVCVAWIAACELLMMHAQTIEEFGRAQRWVQVPIFLGGIAVVVFVHNFIGPGRRWLAYGYFGLRGLSLIFNFTSEVNLNYTEITALHQLDLWDGEKITVAEGVLNHWTRLGQLSLILLVAYVLDASLAAWRHSKGSARRRAMMVGGGIALFISAAMIHWWLVIEGAIVSPFLLTPAFLVVVIAMGYELGIDVVRSSQLQSELQAKEAEINQSDHEMLLLRQEIAHVGRVSMMGQLASAMAHEINQPLGAILRNAEAAELFMQDPSPDLDEVRAILADIRKDDQRAGHVIDQMRGLLKRRDLELQPLEVHELVGEVVALLMTEAQARKVQLQADMPADLPLVKGDRIHLQQVLLNLILNGMDAAQSSGKENRHISIVVRVNSQQVVEFAVIDSGDGISADALAHVFEPFFTTKANGLGMGLPISRTIIEAHGGRLWAENGDAGGARLRFTLASTHKAALE